MANFRTPIPNLLDYSSDALLRFPISSPKVNPVYPSVRHNEDKLNEEMAATLPIRLPSFTYDSPHTKTHLLLQAHFMRQAMPMTDYITDLKSVHDQAMRILQAMVDVSADSGWLKVTLKIMHLVKMIVQGCWMKDNPLIQLPHVEHYQIPLFYNHKSLHKDSSFPDILIAYSNRQDLLRNNLSSELGEREIQQIHKVCETGIILKCRIIDHLALSFHKF